MSNAWNDKWNEQYKEILQDYCSNLGENKYRVDDLIDFVFMHENTTPMQLSENVELAVQKTIRLYDEWWDAERNAGEDWS
ncbi:MAG: hypothetical protein Unbinned834contig1000_53 [Prokaryotic dsDNA virus sp.]|nr:MAG: hypothetical protein Unbinned834contig1000_53 [Prokaryotic dsDNA virus sp.]|tara:strand:- start:28226 stop:28465 length:240 start_codon:yes stop_codon:yes gene_type:complete